MSHKDRGFPSGPRRGSNQRIASGARTAPYSVSIYYRMMCSCCSDFYDFLSFSYFSLYWQRPETSRMTSLSDKQWPPNQITIRGASGPTWIVVANLLRGTSEADIHVGITRIRVSFLWNVHILTLNTPIAGDVSTIWRNWRHQGELSRKNPTN